MKECQCDKCEKKNLLLHYYYKYSSADTKIYQVCYDDLETPDPSVDSLSYSNVGTLFQKELFQKCSPKTGVIKRKERKKGDVLGDISNLGGAENQMDFVRVCSSVLDVHVLLEDDFEKIKNDFEDEVEYLQRVVENTQNTQKQKIQPQGMVPQNQAPAKPDASNTSVGSTLRLRPSKSKRDLWWGKSMRSIRNVATSPRPQENQALVSLLDNIRGPATLNQHFEPKPKQRRKSSVDFFPATPKATKSRARRSTEGDPPTVAGVPLFEKKQRGSDVIEVGIEMLTKDPVVKVKAAVPDTGTVTPATVGGPPRDAQLEANTPVPGVVSKEHLSIGPAGDKDQEGAKDQGGSKD